MKDTRKIFLPLTLDNSTKQLFSGKQLIGFAVTLLGFVAWQAAVFAIGDSTHWHGLIIAAIDLVGCWLIILFLRKVVLRENQMMQQYQQHQNLQKTDLGFIWNIFSIRNGHIYYCNGMQAVIIKLTHGYLLDRPADQEEVHRESINAALGNLTKQGFKFIYLNREVKDSNLEPLMQTERQLFKYKDTPIYKTASQIIKHTFDVCDKIANTEQEFYVIYADNMETIRHLDHAAKEFLNILHGGIYVQMSILTDAEIWQFIADVYGISYINTSELLLQKFQDNQLQMVRILDVKRDDDVPLAETDLFNRTEQNIEEAQPEQTYATEQVQDTLLADTEDDYL